MQPTRQRMQLLLGLAFALAVSAGGAAWAQATDTGDALAAIAPEIAVTIPSVAQLAIGASTLTFDLGADLASAELACVHGPDRGDVFGGSDASGTETALPMGTGFRRGEYPRIQVEGRGAVAGYPGLAIARDGEMQPGSDEDFVCYRTFLLQRFSNLPGWELTVERDAVQDEGFPERIYIRNSGCTGGSELQGLVPLFAGQRLRLADADTSAYCPEGDVLVLATPSAGARGGVARTRLMYTLFAPVFE